MAKTSNFDVEIDFNNLFNLNYSFEVLKGVLELLVQNQKSTNTKINELEENFKMVKIENM